MSTETIAEVKIIAPFINLPGAGRVELTVLGVFCGSDPEEPKICKQFSVDEYTAFGKVVEDSFENRLKIQKIRRGYLPEDEGYEISKESIPLNTISSLQGTYTQLDPNNKRLDRLVTICLD